MSRRTNVPNIGEAGTRRRRAIGFVWLGVASVSLVAMIVLGAPRLARLLLAIPIGLAAIGFFQAREKTCVVLGVLEKRESDAGDPTLTEIEKPIVRRQVVRVVVQSAVIAFVLAAIIYFL